nr:dual specificity protein kinase CLK2-like [Chlorocebus sabaeus]
MGREVPGSRVAGWSSTSSPLGCRDSSRGAAAIMDFLRATRAGLAARTVPHPRGYHPSERGSRGSHREHYRSRKHKRRRSRSWSSGNNRTRRRRREDSDHVRRRRSRTFSRSSSQHSHRKAKRVEDHAEGRLIYHVGDWLQERYEIVSTLGRGTFGRVVQCVDHRRGGTRVALKIVKNVEKCKEAA